MILRDIRLLFPCFFFPFSFGLQLHYLLGLVLVVEMITNGDRYLSSFSCLLTNEQFDIYGKVWFCIVGIGYIAADT